MARNDILPAKEIEYRCMRCGRVETSPKYFYKSNSQIYYNNGYLPICRDCVAELYNKYLLAFHDVRKAIKRMCMALDLYYSDEVVDSCLRRYEAATPPFGEYIKKLNMHQHKKKTFDNSIDEGFIFDPDKINIQYDSGDDEEESIIPTTTIPKSVRARWGSGLSDDDYKMLEEHYRSLKSANPDFDSNQEIFIMDLCFTKMQQTKAMLAGRTDDYIKLTESYKKTFVQAGLKTVKESANEDEFSFGVTAQMIEQYTPAEYYKNKERYKDYDGLGDYITRLLTRPLKNLMFGTSDRDKEYYVKDEEDVIDDE